MNDIFLRILNMGITAGWIVLAVVLVRFLLRKAPKWISCLFWALVALRLVIPFSLESVFSMIPSPEVIPQDIVITVTPQIQSGIPAVNDAINPVIAQRGTVAVREWVSIASWVWLGGMGLMLLYSAVSYLRLRRQVRGALREQGNIFVCDYVASPFILGVFRPGIYLPSGMEEDRRQYVLAHENAHLQRRDHLWKPAGFLLLSVYWFNPLLWVAYVLLCRDIEQACDEKVIAPMDSAHKQGYSEALLACSVSRRTVMACPLAFGEVSVKARIRGILSYKKPAVRIILASVTACVLTALCFLTNPKPCAHTYESRIAVAATCTHAGEETITCSQCRHYYKEPVARLAHTYDAGIVVKEPSCTQPGSMEYRCTGCGSKKTERIEKTAHTPGQLTVTKQPNCTETGIRTAQCTVCRQVCVTESIAPNDIHHMEQTSLQPATCTAPGQSISTCTRCGHTESTELSPTGHDYLRDPVGAFMRCTDTSTRQVCVDCGHEIWVTVPGIGHNWYYNGFHDGMLCSNCGAWKPVSGSYSFFDDLHKPNGTKYPDDMYPVIRIWP